MVKMSVIIPIYNVEKYLDRCMKRVLNQTLEDIEIILVDDGSPDKCPRMCDDYAASDPRVKVIHKENQGLGLARNSGIEIAQGEYITFLDSDDYIDENAYEAIYNRMREAKADACVFSYIDKKDSGEEIPRVNPLGDAVITGEAVLNTVLLGMLGAEPTYYKDTYIGMSVWKCVYSKKIIDKHKLRFCSERELISEDIIFQMAFFPHASIVVTMKDTFYYYCENGSSLSLTKKYSSDKFERYKKLYLEQLRQLVNLGMEKYGSQRVARNFLGNTRVCLKQIAANASINKKEKKKLIKQICGDRCLREMLSWYQWRKNPLRQRLVTFLIKLRWVNALLYIGEKTFS